MPKMMIVDDEGDVRDFAKNFFKKRKIEVATTASGEEALEIFAKEDPGLVLLDIKMNGIDGLETLRRMREISKKIKVIMVTGAEDEISMQRAKELRAIAYIHKPLVLEELERVVLKEIS